MSGRQQKKLNLHIEFSISIFMKFCFKAYKNIMTSSIDSKQISLLGFLYFQLFVGPPYFKRLKFLMGFAT